MWPGARAEDCESAGRRHSRDVSDTLTAVARDWATDWRSPASQDAGITTDRLVDAQGNPWTPGQRAYDRETGRMCQTGLVQQAETAMQQWPSPMAGAAGTEDYNAAGNSDFSRKAMEQATALLTWAAPQARDHFPPHSPERIAAMKALGHGMRNLNDEADQWAAAWRSPSDLSKRGGSQTPEKRQAGGHTVNLQEQAEHWMAPQVPNGGRSTDHATQVGRTMMHNGKKVQLGLESQAQRWPAPAARDHKGSSEGSITRQDGKSRADMLDYAAEQFFHPPLFPDQPIAAGSMSSTAGPNSNQPSVRRKLNPIFSEALMRWPTGLSGFARPATALTRWQQLMRSYLSALASGFSAGDEQMDLFA